MKIYRFHYFIFTLIILTACNSIQEKEKTIELAEIPNHFKEIQIDSLVTFDCPKEMLQVENLKLQGDYQFADLINVQYAVVQIESKESDLKSFTTDKLDDLKLKMVDPVSSEFEQFSLNEIQGYTTEIDAKVYGWPSKLHYWISIVELHDKFVTTIAWTTEDRMKDFKDEAEIIVKSFRMKD